MGLSVCLSWGHCGAQFIPALSLPLNPGVLLPVHASARAQDSRGGGGDLTTGRCRGRAVGWAVSPPGMWAQGWAGQRGSPGGGGGSGPWELSVTGTLSSRQCVRKLSVGSHPSASAGDSETRVGAGHGRMSPACIWRWQCLPTEPSGNWQSPPAGIRVVGSLLYGAIL